MEYHNSPIGKIMNKMAPKMIENRDMTSALFSMSSLRGSIQKRESYCDRTRDN